MLTSYEMAVLEEHVEQVGLPHDAASLIQTLKSLPRDLRIEVAAYIMRDESPRRRLSDR